MRALLIALCLSMTSCAPRPEPATERVCASTQPQLAFMCLGPSTVAMGGIAVSPNCGYHLTVACVAWEDRPNPRYQGGRR